MAAAPKMSGKMNGQATGSKDVGGCMWINWNSNFICKVLPDPTRIFSILVIAIMVLKYLHANEWKLELALSGFFLNPYVVFFCTIATVTLYLAKPTTTTKEMSVYDKWALEWYWWNAWLYHAVMDGASGTFGLVPVVVQQYHVLDKRFATHHVVPWLVGLVELLVMFPLCLFTLYAIRKHSPLRYPLELITSTFQFMGMVMFVGAEVYEGQLNVPALDPVGIEGNRWANVKFDLYHFTYYWFGFWFCNLVWGVVPYYRAMRAVEECRAVFGKYKNE